MILFAGALAAQAQSPQSPPAGNAGDSAGSAGASANQPVTVILPQLTEPPAIRVTLGRSDPVMVSGARTEEAPVRITGQIKTESDSGVTDWLSFSAALASAIFSSLTWWVIRCQRKIMEHQTEIANQAKIANVTMAEAMEKQTSLIAEQERHAKDQTESLKAQQELMKLQTQSQIKSLMLHGLITRLAQSKMCLETYLRRDGLRFSEQAFDSDNDDDISKHASFISKQICGSNAPAGIRSQVDKVAAEMLKLEREVRMLSEELSQTQSQEGAGS